MMSQEVGWPGLEPPGPKAQARLQAFSDLLRKWNRAINLVAPGSLEHLWPRHIWDSAQIFAHRPESCRNWLDLGSGGGFPGLIVAILADEAAPELKVELVDSDQRKCTFLRTAAQTLDLDLTVTCARVEALAPRGADVVSARALAPLDQLLGLALPHLGPGGICLFLKGAAIEAEATLARQHYRFDLELFPSHTDGTGVIARIANLAHV